MFRFYVTEPTYSSHLYHVLILYVPPLQSVSFSGPGMYYSKWQFKTVIDGKVLNPQLSEAVTLGTTFMPYNDLVPRVDLQVGNIQQTACSANNPGDCHYLSPTICDLLFRCGDDQHMERFKDCTGTKQTFDYDKLEEFLYP